MEQKWIKKKKRAVSFNIFDADLIYVSSSRNLEEKWQWGVYHHFTLSNRLFMDSSLNLGVKGFFPYNMYSL